MVILAPSLDQNEKVVVVDNFRTTVYSDQGWQYPHIKWGKTLKKTRCSKACPAKETV